MKYNFERLLFLVISLSSLPRAELFHCYEYYKPGFYRHPSICSAFYQCNKDGTQLLRHCAKGMNFRVTGLGLGYCDATGNALCVDDANDEDTGEVIFSCPRDTLYKFIDGHFPNPLHCNKFFLCVDGNSYEMSCPVGFEWSASMGYCDMPFRAYCKQRHFKLDGDRSKQEDLDSGDGERNGESNEKADIVPVDPSSSGDTGENTGNKSLLELLL